MKNIKGFEDFDSVNEARKPKEIKEVTPELVEKIKDFVNNYTEEVNKNMNVIYIVRYSDLKMTKGRSAKVMATGVKIDDTLVKFEDISSIHITPESNNKAQRGDKKVMKSIKVMG